MKYCKQCLKHPIVVQDQDGNWNVYCVECNNRISDENKFKAIDKWNSKFGANICYCLESSSCLPRNQVVEEANLSNKEVIQKAASDCVTKSVVYTMNELYFQSLLLSARKFECLKSWKIIFIYDNGIQKDITNNPLIATTIWS